MTDEKRRKKIFVTVGNGKFETLIKEIDRLKGTGLITEEVVIQLGHGEYKPKNCQWFTFESPLDKYYEDADLIISHGGPGIVFEILRRGKKLIAVPNRDRTDPHHQVEYLRAMAQETSALIYCDQIKLLESCLKKAENHIFAQYNQPECKMHDVVKAYLKQNVQ